MPAPWTPPKSDTVVWHPPATDTVVDSPRLSKDEVGAVMRQRYPQAFANPNAPQSVGEVFSSDHPLDTALEFGKGLLWDTATGIGNALLHPIDAARAAAKSHEDELKKAVIAAHQGNYSGAGGHALASVIPVIGPIAANIGEEIGATNEVSRNMGRATALMISSSPENVIKPAAPYVKGAIKGVWQNATRPAEFPIRLKGVPVEIPNTPQIAADVAEGAGIGHFVGPVGSATGAAIGAAKNIAQGVYRGVQDVVAQKRAAAFGRLREQVKAARDAAKPAPVSAEPSVLPPPAPMPEAQPMVNLPGPSGTFVDVPPAPAAPNSIPAPQAPSIVELKRAEAMQRLNPQAPVAEAPRFDPRSLPPDPIKSQPWYGDAVAAMRARRVGAPEVAPVETVNPAVADESQVGMIRQMAQERTPNALADAFRNISPEQRAEVIKAFDRERIVAAQDAMRQQMKAQGFDAETAELAAQTEARPDFTDTVPARIAKARANKAEGLFRTAREMGINPEKMAKLSPAKWEEIAAKAGVRKPTWTANGSETVREVIQMAREWEAKNGPIQAPPKPMKKPSVIPGGLDTPEKIAAAEQLRQALEMEEAPVAEAPNMLKAVRDNRGMKSPFDVVKSAAEKLGLDVSWDARRRGADSQYLTVELPSSIPDEPIYIKVRVSNHAVPEGRGGFWRNDDPFAVQSEGVNEPPHISFDPSGALAKDAETVLREIKSLAKGATQKDFDFIENHGGARHYDLEDMRWEPSPRIKEIQQKFYAQAEATRGKASVAKRVVEEKRFQARLAATKERVKDFGKNGVLTHADAKALQPGDVVEQLSPDAKTVRAHIVKSVRWSKANNVRVETVKGQELMFFPHDNNTHYRIKK